MYFLYQNLRPEQDGETKGDVLNGLLRTAAVDTLFSVGTGKLAH
jgi:hypothetical protein